MWHTTANRNYSQRNWTSVFSFQSSMERKKASRNFLFKEWTRCCTSANSWMHLKCASCSVFNNSQPSSIFLQQWAFWLHWQLCNGGYSYHNFCLQLNTLSWEQLLAQRETHFLLSRDKTGTRRFMAVTNQLLAALCALTPAEWDERFMLSYYNIAHKQNIIMYDLLNTTLCVTHLISSKCSQKNQRWWSHLFYSV